MIRFLTLWVIACAAFHGMSLLAQEVPASKSQPGHPQAAPQTSIATPNPAKAAVLEEFSSSLENVTSHVGRAVVQIFARSYVPVQDAGSSDQLLTSQNSSGSGVILTPDG